MYEKNDKQRLYWLIDQYLFGKIDEPTFCDEFYYSDDLEVNSDTLTNIEKVDFSELSQVSSRFSQYEEDHKLDPRAFSTLEELKQMIIEPKRNYKSKARSSGPETRGSSDLIKKSPYGEDPYDINNLGIFLGNVLISAHNAVFSVNEELVNGKSPEEIAQNSVDAILEMKEEDFQRIATWEDIGAMVLLDGAVKSFSRPKFGLQFPKREVGITLKDPTPQVGEAFQSFGYSLEGGNINLSGRSMTNGRFDFVVTMDGKLRIGMGITTFQMVQGR